MIAGVDTGFFFALEEKNPAALKAWEEQEIITSVIVLYELEKKLLQGHLKQWPAIMSDISRAVPAVVLTEDIAARAARISHKYGLPGLDSLILASLLDANVKQIYTTDSHFELYKEKSVEIIIMA
ncbi:MAG: PIN domain-containing protein [Nitrospiraceae bacterium]|nr:PIN domain-containing protein [Nitrospiraceae bacterium]